MFFHSAGLALASLLIVFPVLAQQTTVFRGVVEGGNMESFRLQVELIDTQRAMPADRVNVAQNGEFEFRHAPNGLCELRVLDEQGELIKRDWVAPATTQYGYSINIADKKLERPVTGVVSGRRLAHKIPKTAMKEFEKARKATQKGDEAAAVQHLERAVLIDPEFMEAHNNLGTKYIKAGRAGDAFAMFQRAGELDPGSPSVHLNMAVALLHLRKPAEAEMEARKALGAGAAGPTDMAQKILKLSLMAQGKIPLSK